MSKKKKSQTPSGIKIVSKNRRARFDYELVEVFEAGLSLVGTEIKSMRLAGKVSLQKAYVQERGGELWLTGCNIAEYAFGNRENHDAERPRKLLLHRREIDNIIHQLKVKGLTCIPTKLYLKKGRAKCEIALARGKKQYDKRQDIAKKDSKRNLERELKGRY